MDLLHLLEKLGVRAMRPRADGRYSLNFDRDRRLDVHPLPDGRLVLETAVVFLPAEGADRSALLERALRFSTSRMPRRHDVLCLSAGSDALLLQCEVPARAGVVATESALTQFLQAVDAWWAVFHHDRGTRAQRPAQAARRVGRPVLQP